MTPEERIKAWREGGPAQFAKEALDAEPEAWQSEASKILVKRRRLSVRSGHGVGKSAFLAWCILWFETCYFPARVPATAPTAHQLEDVLWAELARWHRVMKDRLPALGAEFDWTAGAFRLRSNSNESFAVARTSRPEKPEALQGFHCENILFLIDEASGVPDNIFEVAEGALSTEGAFVVMAANPTRQSGYFYDSHHKMRAEWGTLHVDGEKCPRVSRAYIERMAKQLTGIDRPSPTYLDAAQAWIQDKIWLFNLTETAKLARLLEVFKYGYKRYGIHHFVIDSLMMLDVPEDGHGAMSAQKEAMRQIATFARSNHVHIHLVAHPRKGQDEKKGPGKLDVSGSSKITDAADNVISVWADLKEEGERTDEPDGKLELHKQRNGEIQSKKLWLYFNRSCQQYSTDKARRRCQYVKFSSQEEYA